MSVSYFFTFLKLFHAFQVDAESSRELEQWNEMLKSDAIKLCQDNNFNPGFFEGSDNNCAVDAYELKVIFTLLLSNLKYRRLLFISEGFPFMMHYPFNFQIRLEHIIERIALISDAASTEKPSAVTSSLFIGGALAARSVYTLQYLGITNILCLCTNEIGQSETQYPDLFEYKNFSVSDIYLYFLPSLTLMSHLLRFILWMMIFLHPEKKKKKKNST